MIAPPSPMLRRMDKALALSLLFACADSEPPTWSGEAQLETSAVETSSLTLSWGDASDNEALEGFLIEQDGDTLAELGADAREHQVAGLADATTYSFTIIAKDATGNPSEPLHAEATTLDGTPPSFEAGAQVIAVPNEDATRVTIRWPEATDNVGVARYEIQRNGEPAGQISDATTIELEGGADAIQVFAVDERGNTSAPIGSAGDAAARTEIAATDTPEPGGHPDMAPVIQLSPAVQRTLQRTQHSPINRQLKITPMLQLPMR